MKKILHPFPSDVVEAFVPAWTYLPHDVELIKQA